VPMTPRPTTKVDQLRAMREARYASNQREVKDKPAKRKRRQKESEEQ
jgi:hypothetical protein